MTKKLQIVQDFDAAELMRPKNDKRARAETETDADVKNSNDPYVRLQKALANAGIASRRACETLITRGRVEVNGEKVFTLGTKIDPQRDRVSVDGVIVQLAQNKRYFVLNKPTGVVSTMADDNGRPDLRQYTAKIKERLYNVGRLDTDTSGLLILTNDGELAHKLAHPKFGVEKTYIAKVLGKMTAATAQKLKIGIELEDGPIKADRIKILPGANKQNTLVEITLHSGRNRIVRRMLAAVGHPVKELVRRQFGPLALGTLQNGQMRELTQAELGALLTSAEQQKLKNSAINGKTVRVTGRKTPVTAGRPGDGAGAKGLKGIAAARTTKTNKNTSKAKPKTAAKKGRKQ